MPPTLSIVIPVYNSADCLSELCTHIESSLSQVNYELILVNDGSKDKSWQQIRELQQVNPGIIGISLRKNYGQDNAIMAGLNYAIGEFIVIMDDDLQHAPDDILKLYEECRKGYDVCYALFEKKYQKTWKNLGSKINGKLSEKLLAKPGELYLSPFKILRKEIAKEIIHYAGPYPYIDALILNVTSNISQIPLKHHTRFKGHSNFSFSKSLAVFLRHATGYSVYPLRAVIYLGFVATVISLILGILLVIDFVKSGEQVEGWIATNLLIVFFGGVTITCLGIIGEYIGRMFLTINNKPQYSIQEIIGKKKSVD